MTISTPQTPNAEIVRSSGMVLPRRFGLYLSAKPSGWLMLELAFKGRRLVLPVPWKKPFMWGYGFVFHEGWFWIFRGQESLCFKTRQNSEPGDLP